MTTLPPLQMIEDAPTFLENIFYNKQVNLVIMKVGLQFLFQEEKFQKQIESQVL